MESPTSNSEHHKHHAHHSLEDTSPPPSNLKGDDHKDPLAPEQKEEELVSVPLKSLQSVSAPVECPVCGVTARTITKTQTGNFTFLAAGGFCLVSCAILAWVPFFLPSTMDVLHYCGNCQASLALWHRSKRIEILAYPEVNKDEKKDVVRD